MPAPQKIKAKDARCFQPSSFASRKAEADEDNATRKERRLVSLGPSVFPQKNLKTGELEAFDVELFTDLDHPGNRFVRFPNQPGLLPLQGDSSVRDEVARTTLQRPLGRPQSSAYVETQLDEPRPREV